MVYIFLDIYQYFLAPRIHSLHKPAFFSSSSILKQAPESLPKLKEGPDPNLEDISHITRTIKDLFNIKFNNKYIPKEKVVEIVEIVEEKLLRPIAINPIYRDDIKKKRQ